jgi:hypothetical protein
VFQDDTVTGSKGILLSYDRGILHFILRVNPSNLLLNRSRQNTIGFERVLFDPSDRPGLVSISGREPVVYLPGITSFVIFTMAKLAVKGCSGTCPQASQKWAGAFFSAYLPPILHTLC